LKFKQANLRGRDNIMAIIGFIMMVFNWDNPDEFWWWLGLFFFILGII
jgi:hypothetical protein